MQHLMKTIYYIPLLLLSLLVIWSCEDEEFTLESPVAPTSIAIDTTVATDSSGRVQFNVSAEGATVYHFYFGTGDSESPTVSQDGSAEFTYSRTGTYQARVVAFGTGGLSSARTIEVDVVVKATIDPEVLRRLTGSETSGSKRWVWQQTERGHFGVGPADGTTPDFFTADANGLDPCLYDDVIVFSTDNGDNTYELIPGEETYINWADVPTLFPGATSTQNVDECRDASDVLTLNTNFTVRTSEVDGEEVNTIILNPLTPMSYYVNASEFQILELTEDVLSVRTIQTTPDGGELAWYFTFVPEGSAGGNGGGGDNGGDNGGSSDIDFEDLVFADEFDTDGAPDPDVWGYELGDGCPDLCGWGNSELQWYTDRPENVIVEDGVLKITARRETLGTRNFTSARLISKDKYEFTYGRVETRAKMPEGVGTWPAIWMLGADIDTNPWPGAGEIDILEHTGKEPNKILGTTHSPSGFGGTANGSSTTIDDAINEFNVYAIEWTEESIKFFVNDEMYYEYAPEEKNDETYPFNKDFYFLMNIAMGGTLGGNIAPEFNSATMEVDYIRVYQ